jgi:hypothetical protein
MLSCSVDENDDPVDQVSRESSPASDPFVWLFHTRRNRPKIAQSLSEGVATMPEVAPPVEIDSGGKDDD